MRNGKNRDTLRVTLTPDQIQYVSDTLTPALRGAALLKAADKLSGKRWQELTANLSESNEQSLALWPMFVGGDSPDMDTFVLDCWRRPVTDENIRQVFEAFNTWYQMVAPDEYHPPTKPAILNDWQW